MIGIIKQGKQADKLPIMRFNCYSCGCIFTANKDDYVLQEDFKNKGRLLIQSYFCDCPNCKRTNIVYRERKI